MSSIEWIVLFVFGAWLSFTRFMTQFRLSGSSHSLIVFHWHLVVSIISSAAPDCGVQLSRCVRLWCWRQRRRQPFAPASEPGCVKDIKFCWGFAVLGQTTSERRNYMAWY
jgi:hypothetical protein